MAKLPEPLTERRRLTRNSIYRTLFEAATPYTKQELAAVLGLSMPTVHQNVAELLDSGLIRQAGNKQSTGGRRPNCLTIAENARFAVGVAVDRESFRFLAANLRSDEIAYQKYSHSTVLPVSELGVLLAQTLESFLQSFGLNPSKLLGVGIAIPGIVNAEGTCIVNAPTLRLKNVDITALTAAIPAPTFVANDATSGGYAEWLARPKQDSLAYLSLENGVGGAVLVNGTPYVGANGRSGEFGHLCVETDGLPCKCGKLGCLEAYCSARRISSDLGLTLDGFFEGLAAGNPTNEVLWQDYLHHLAVGISSIRMVLDCDIVLGGFLMQYLEPYLPQLRAMVCELGPFDENGDFIKPCHYPKHAIPLGVSLHFIREFVGAL